MDFKPDMDTIANIDSNYCGVHEEMMEKTFLASVVIVIMFMILLSGE